MHAGQICLPREALKESEADVHGGRLGVHQSDGVVRLGHNIAGSVAGRRVDCCQSALEARQEGLCPRVQSPYHLRHARLSKRNDLHQYYACYATKASTVLQHDDVSVHISVFASHLGRPLLFLVFSSSQVGVHKDASAPGLPLGLPRGGMCHLR